MQNFEAEMISNTPNFKILKYCVVLISRREAGLGLGGGGHPILGMARKNLMHLKVIRHVQ